MKQHRLHCEDVVSEAFGDRSSDEGQATSGWRFYKGLGEAVAALMELVSTDPDFGTGARHCLERDFNQFWDLFNGFELVLACFSLLLGGISRVFDASAPGELLAQLLPPLARPSFGSWGFRGSRATRGC